MLNDILNYLKSLNVAFVDEFVPFYISSAMCHLANLENRKREFYTEQSLVKDLRVHMFFVAPPGYFKSFLLQLLLDGPSSIFYNGIKCAYASSMTEAGYVGTIRHIDGSPVEVKGAAWDYRDHIVGIEEFSAVTNIMTQQHSLNLDNALLTSLDSGKLSKRLAAGELKYITRLTLWGASQPLRFNLKSGLGRRFCFIYFIPNAKEREKIKLMRRKGRNVRPNFRKLKAIEEQVLDIHSKIEQIESIKFDIDPLLNKLKVVHSDESLYERLALGFVLARNDFKKDVLVKGSDWLYKKLLTERKWRRDIAYGADTEQVIVLLRDAGFLSQSELIKQLTEFGLTRIGASKLIETMVKTKQISRIEAKTGGKKTITYKLVR
ncbi:MAG: hypothetical protein N2V78_09340 [Methanophagales archaeon]|nr:hypothetical protein [Methanophagales archaeon]